MCNNATSKLLSDEWWYGVEGRDLQLAGRLASRGMREFKKKWDVYSTVTVSTIYS